MTDFTPEELSSCWHAHDKGAALLEVFITHAQRINNARRKQYKEEHPNQIYFSLPTISDELSFSAWYLESPTKVIIPEAWGSDYLELPVDVLTGTVTAEGYVTHLWIELEKKQRENAEAYKERKLQELETYAKKYPQEASEIINRINQGA